MIRVAGVGPGSEKYLTLEVKELILSAEKVWAFERVKETLKDLRGDISLIESYKILLDLDPNEDNLILASGDPLFFGIVDYLKRNKLEIASVHPGLSSVQYLANKLQISWNDCQFLSCHGRPLEEMEIKGKRFFVLTDKQNTADVISKKLFHMGFTGKIWVGENLSYPEEKIDQIKIGDRAGVESLSVLYVEVENGIS